MAASPSDSSSVSAEGRGSTARAAVFPILLIWGVTLLCLAAVDFAGYQAFISSLEFWIKAR